MSRHKSDGRSWYAPISSTLTSFQEFLLLLRLAYLEWIIAFGFILYPLSFWLDLRLTQPRMVGYPTEGEARSSGDVYGASIRTLRPQQMTEV